MPLSRLEALKLLKEDANKPRRGGGRTKADPTMVRELSTWMKLNHHIKEDGCDNPNCIDPRPKNDYGTNICAAVRDKYMCRYCFLAGWYLDDSI